MKVTIVQDQVYLDSLRDLVKSHNHHKKNNHTFLISQKKNWKKDRNWNHFLFLNNRRKTVLSRELLTPWILNVKLWMRNKNLKSYHSNIKFQQPPKQLQ